MKTIEYSVIIPAYNEEALLARTLEALRAAMMTVALMGEVIVVDNNSTDKTPKIAQKFGADIIFEKINQISRARNTGAKRARGRYLIFLDADTLISPKLLQTALENLKDNACCGGGATVRPDKSIKPFYQRGLDFWNRFSAKFGVAAGSFIYCLREGFEAVGGFSEKVYASEEIWFSIHYKRWGKTKGMGFKVINQAPVITSTRKFDWFSGPQIILILFLIVLFPFIIRSRTLCNLWYYRPEATR
ncbi:MAG: glycosyltransferase [Deltaproteobacteria bacterium]|nr:MAG: glycosyltransferase [Deltaproteobacteria bacterium]